VPVFALLIWLHTPLWQYFARDRRLAVEIHRGWLSRRSSWSARATDHVPTVVRLFALDFNWAVCLFLILPCGEDATGCAGDAVDIRRRSKNDGVRLIVP